LYSILLNDIETIGRNTPFLQYVKVRLG